jgi:hypothetical protein
MDGTGLAELEQHVVSRLVHRVWTSYWKRRDFFVFPSFLLRESAQDWVPPHNVLFDGWKGSFGGRAGGWGGCLPPHGTTSHHSSSTNRLVG